MKDYVMAGSETLSLVQATELSQNVSARIRAKLAANPNCPSMVLRLLCQDSNTEVRSAVATNPSIEEEVMQLLLEDESITVRFQMAGNAKIGELRLQKLIFDSNAYVAERAMATFEAIMLETQLSSLDLPPTESKPLLGELMLATGLISKEDLDFALEQARKYALPLGNILLLRRMTSRYLLVEALLVQNLIGRGRLSLDEGIYYMKREAKLNLTNMFRPHSASYYQDAG